jgi:hypothetical protein
MGDEKRQHPRRAVLLECRIDGLSGLAGTHVSDLSASGCFVESRTPVNVGSFIRIGLTFGGALLNLTGRIVHVQPTIGFGMAFDPLSTEVLRSFLELPAEQVLEHT